MKPKLLSIFLLLVSTFNLFSQPSAQHARIVPPEEEIDGYFGSAVDIYEDYAIIGSKLADNGVEDSKKGSAYIYKIVNGDWVLHRKLNPSNLPEGAIFGVSVSMQGDFAVVGATGDKGAKTATGTAYVFYKNKGGNDNWGMVAKLFANYGQTSDYFGYSVDIYNDIVVVGVPNASVNNVVSGAAYIFKKHPTENGLWGEVTKLVPSDPIKDKRFGNSVSIYANNILVGAYGNDNNKIYSGSAYLFSKDVGGSDKWGLLKKIIDADSKDYDKFGYSSKIYKDYLLVGATNKDFNAGSALIYHKNSGGTNNWGHVKTIKGTNSNWAEEFGTSVDISDDYIVVGTPNDSPLNDLSRPGSVTVFKKSNEGIENWVETAFLFDSTGHTEEKFGKRVAINKNKIIIGADEFDGNVENGGLAFIYGEPIPIIISQPASLKDVCSLELIDFTVSGANIDTFEWQIKTKGASQFQKLTDNTTYSGTGTAKLTIKATKNMEESLFRCKVSNSNGYKISSECSFLLETEAPVITSNHPDITVAANSNCQFKLPLYHDYMTVTDNCPAPVNLIQSPASDINISGPVNKITLSAADQAYNSTSIEFNINVADLTKPELNCVSSKTVEISNSASTYTVSGTEFDPIMVIDNCVVPTISNNINNKVTLAGEKLSPGKTKIIWSAVDQSQNISKCEFEIEVKKSVAVIDDDSEFFTIYPVPVSDFINIVTQLTVDKINILDINGNVVKTLGNNANTKIYIGDIKSGFYILTIISGKDVLIRKFIKN